MPAAAASCLISLSQTAKPAGSRQRPALVSLSLMDGWAGFFCAAKALLLCHAPCQGREPCRGPETCRFHYAVRAAKLGSKKRASCSPSASRRSLSVKPFVLLAIFASLLVIPAAARARGESVPKLDVETSCRDAKIYGTTDPKQTYKNCMLDEREAEKQLRKKWSQYKAATRRNCIAAGATPSPSYVELLTCIEMYEETLKPSSGGGGGGGGGALGSPSPRPTLAPGPRAMPR
jgi:hypothetical protein